MPSSLRSKTKRSFNDQKDARKGITGSSLTVSSDRPIIQRIFLDFQWAWINDDQPLAIFEKCRRTGISWSTSYRSNLLAVSNKTDTIYSSYNLPACRNFIKNTAKWAKAWNVAIRTYMNEEIVNEEGIQTYRIEYANGRTVEAIPGNPVNLRDRQGELVLDEFAFRVGDQEAIKDAAMAVLHWGGSIRVISTHNGEDNFFNSWCKEIKSDPMIGSHHYIDFMGAIKQGLYKKICEVKNEIWTPEKEQLFVSQTYKRYGEGSQEELDTQPKKYSSRDIFREEYFKFVDIDDYDVAGMLKIRYFDLASSVNKTSYYSATIQLGLWQDRFVLLDAQAEKYEAAEGDNWIEQIVQKDDPGTIQLIEQEPGSSGDKYVRYMINRLSHSYVTGYKPAVNKLLRAIPIVPALKNGDLVVRNRPYVVDGKVIEPRELVRILCKFSAKPEPLVTDLMDCLSGSFEYAMDNWGTWRN